MAWAMKFQVPSIGLGIVSFKPMDTGLKIKLIELNAI